jgi:hypothetical protein
MKLPPLPTCNYGRDTFGQVEIAVNLDRWDANKAMINIR